MPTYPLTVTTAVTTIPAEATRTVLLVQNLDTVATDYLWISDEDTAVLASGIRIAAQGGSVLIRQADGFDTSKPWYLYATTAATPVRYMTGHQTPQVEVPHGNGTPDPQEPNNPLDAPNMRRIR